VERAAGQRPLERTHGDDLRSPIDHDFARVRVRGPAGLSRDAAPVLRRWSIGGNTATSDDRTDTLSGLAAKVGAHYGDWTCIKPLGQRTSTHARLPANFDEHYELYVQNGDTFDISNLTATTGPSLKMFLFDPVKDAMNADIAKRFYPGSVQSIGVDNDIEKAAGSGSTPIADMVIFGHAGGDSMWGDPAGLNAFTPHDFDPADPPPSFTLASAGLLPRRCWFTRNASTRAVGCDSETFGNDFAGHYLRRGAHVVTTTKSVRPKCSAPRRHPVTGACLSYDGLDFASSWTTTATMLEGPFWTTADFHAGKYWKTIGGRL
jgi:hypothetical protein